jgi:hypothetical protein
MREGGSGVTHKLPGRTQYDAITLERGVTHDPDLSGLGQAVAVARRRRSGSTAGKYG